MHTRGHSSDALCACRISSGSPALTINQSDGIWLSGASPRETRFAGDWRGRGERFVARFKFNGVSRRLLRAVFKSLYNVFGGHWWWCDWMKWRRITNLKRIEGDPWERAKSENDRNDDRIIREIATNEGVCTSFWLSETWMGRLIERCREFNRPFIW